jgi:hypothetical protein
MAKGDVTAYQEARALSGLRARSSLQQRFFECYMPVYDADERRFDLQHSPELRVVRGPLLISKQQARRLRLRGLTISELSRWT